MYEIKITKPDGTIQTGSYKSIREMSIKTGISYHNLKVIYERKNEQSKTYKNTSVNNLLKYIQVFDKNPDFNFTQ
jgi:hypothetical protein